MLIMQYTHVKMFDISFLGLSFRALFAEWVGLDGALHRRIGHMRVNLGGGKLLVTQNIFQHAYVDLSLTHSVAAVCLNLCTDRFLFSSPASASLL